MLKKLIKTLIIIIASIIILIIGITSYVVISTNKYIINIKNIKDVNYTIVLGAQVKGNKPSHMLQDRLDKAYEIYVANNQMKFILSGDGQEENYDEVKVMKEYLIEKGIPEENLIEDKLGLSTSESMYRLKHEYHIDKVIIVTQQYHLYRSLYLAKELDIESYGIPAKKIRYSGQLYRDIREVLAIVKDFIKVSIKK